MDQISKHLKKYPNARPATLALIPVRDAMTARLREENERLREQSRLQSMTFGQRVLHYAGKIKALAEGWR